MIGQKEDRLLYPNTGQAFSIDTISQETSRLASWKSPLNISLLSKNDGNAVARTILLKSKIVRKQGPLQIKITSFSDIFRSEQNGASYSVFIETCAHTLLGPNVWQCSQCSINYTCDTWWGTWSLLGLQLWGIILLNSSGAHTLLGTVKLLYRCSLFQPLYTCTWTNLRVTYSGQTHRWSESIIILTNERQSI